MGSKLLNFIDITKYFPYEIGVEAGSVKLGRHCDQQDGQVLISGKRISLPNCTLPSLMLSFLITRSPL
jgi:hypothetical protein